MLNHNINQYIYSFLIIKGKIQQYKGHEIEFKLKLKYIRFRSYFKLFQGVFGFVVGYTRTMQDSNLRTVLNFSSPFSMATILS